MIKLAPIAVLLLLLSGCAAAAPQPLDPAVQASVKAEQDGAWYVYSFSWPDVERPDVDVVELVPYWDRDAKIVDCLRDAGWEVTPDNIGWEGEDVPEFSLAHYVCKAQYPTDPDSLRTPPPD